MTQDPFAGDKKEGQSLLHDAEEHLKAFLVPCVPQGIETYHLTLTTIVWSILVIVFSWLAIYQRQWMWGVSLMVVAQYVTDLLDGAIGRGRNTGLIKWGFYMDHFLDYIFLCAMLIGYSLLMPNNLKVIMFFIMAVIGAFMVNSFLQFAATNKFRIAYWGIGPTEIRIVFILINTLIIYVNQLVYVQALPYILGVAVFGLFFTAYNTQRELWKIDMTAKAEAEGQAPPTHDVQGLVIRHFLLCFVLASLAFWILIAKIGGPYSKALAALVYIGSWIPLVLAFQHKSWIHFKENPQVKRFGPLAIAAVVLVICTWAGMNLMPFDRDIGFLLKPEGAQRILTDSEVIQQAQVQFEQLDLDSCGEGNLEDWLKTQVQCRDLMQQYQAYNRLDYLDKPGLHTDAFLIYNAAMALHRTGVLTMAEQANAEQREWLDQAYPELDIKAKTFTHWRRDLLKPDVLFLFGFNATHINLLKKQIDAQDDSEVYARRQALVKIATDNSETYYQLIRELPELW